MMVVTQILVVVSLLCLVVLVGAAVLHYRRTRSLTIPLLVAVVVFLPRMLDPFESWLARGLAGAGETVTIGEMGAVLSLLSRIVVLLLLAWIVLVDARQRAGR